MNKRKVVWVLLICAFTIAGFIAGYTVNSLYNKEQYLNETAETIILNSKNDTEKVHRIIVWENKFGLTTFKPSIISQCLRLPKDAKWHIFLKKANCGERAIIFEDMAERTKLKYRRVVIDGYIDPPNNKMNNHRWSEVKLDGDWRIADSGFNLSYPEDNQSFFTLEKGWLIGHVAIQYDNETFGDCTDLYVNRRGKLIIQAVKDGKNIKDADVSINMTYKNLTCPVVSGKTIKRSTNNSGLCEINLGIYDSACYMVKVSDKGIFYGCFGRENVTIANETNYLVIELDERKIQWWTTALFVGTFILAFFVIAVFRKAIRR